MWIPLAIRVLAVLVASTALLGSAVHGLAKDLRWEMVHNRMERVVASPEVAAAGHRPRRLWPRRHVAASR